MNLPSVDGAYTIPEFEDSVRRGKGVIYLRVSGIWYGVVLGSEIPLVPSPYEYEDMLKFIQSYRLIPMGVLAEDSVDDWGLPNEL